MGNRICTAIIALVILFVSNAATLAVNAAAAPSITAQPVGQTVVAGQTATFSVTAAGTGQLKYQWAKNGVDISGATSSSYTTPATTTANSGAQFSVEVSNNFGSVISNTVVLVVNVAPTITTQPVSQTVTAGQAATFWVTATGTAPLGYQWRKNGVNISGATSSTYTTPATTTADSGAQFSVAVGNPAGSVTSNNATLTVNAAVAPSITTQPVSQTVTAGQTATFSVTATGTAPLGYQWRKNGVNISGASSSSYTTPATTTADSGAQFSVFISNSVSSVASSSATLTVNAAAVAPSITTQPSSQTITAGQTATFSVAATGTAPLSYQWRKNGANISGATSSSYTTPATTTADSGAQFSVFISNSVSSVTSSSATLTVNSTQTSFTPIRINSAGGAYTDSQGRVWSADTAFSGGTAATSTNAIANTVDDVLYQSERWGPSTYTFTVPTGTYLVTLKFAETWFTGSGQRLFNVAINGTTVLANFDIVAAAGGPNIALDQTFTVNAGSGSNNLQIQFIHLSGQPDNPKINAIDIESGTTTPTAPNITTQPASSTVIAGQTATFSVAASGTAPLSYQWRKNGVNISGAISSSYTTPATTTADSGAQFSVVVSNSAGSATSSIATLTVNAAAVAPAITTQPASSTVIAGQTATFSVAASGTAPLSYQWRKNGANLSGAISSSYTTPATTTADSGAQFSVVVSNSAGSATSGNATLTVGATTKLLSPNPTSLSFGNVNVSLSSLLTSTLTNTGNSNVTISGVSISGTGLTVSGLSTGQIIAPGQSAILSVVFLPLLSGSMSGSVMVTSDASNSPTTISLSGMGVLLVTHSATVSWSASSSSVVGYNVYSGTVSGGPYNKVTTSPVATVSYKDSSVQSGKTYYYVITAVDSSSVESVYSNQVSAVIP